jgi:hypothetical protein
MRETVALLEAAVRGFASATGARDFDRAERMLTVAFYLREQERVGAS